MKLTRLSPVQFNARAAETRRRGAWQVVASYEDEGEGPWLIDLSHRQRWDFQAAELDLQTPFGLQAPARPGQVSVQGELLISRMNGTQVAVWHLGGGEPEAAPADKAYTDMTDAHCMLAVLGADTRNVMEHLSRLDLFDPRREHPFLSQGPVLHIPCQVVTLGPDCVLMTFSRGYGQSFADAMLHAASGCGLQPAGEDRFNDWLKTNITTYISAS